jgi:hypothetical protein
MCQALFVVPFFFNQARTWPSPSYLLPWYTLFPGGSTREGKFALTDLHVNKSFFSLTDTYSSTYLAFEHHFRWKTTWIFSWESSRVKSVIALPKKAGFYLFWTVMNSDSSWRLIMPQKPVRKSLFKAEPLISFFLLPFFGSGCNKS